MDPQIEYITTARLLKQYILQHIQGGYLNPESTPIISYLIAINETSFISFDSQPYSNTKYDNTVFIQRAYINGIYPKNKISSLVQSLPKGFVLSETLLNKDGDILHVHNRNDYDTPLVSRLEVQHKDLPDTLYIPELYPIYKTINEDEVKWIRGHSGNVINPESRDYITDLLFRFSDKLTNEIINDYSFVQIWSENIEDPLFPTLLDCIIMVD